MAYYWAEEKISAGWCRLLRLFFFQAIAAGANRAMLFRLFVPLVRSLAASLAAPVSRFGRTTSALLALLIVFDLFVKLVPPFSRHDSCPIMLMYVQYAVSHRLNRRLGTFSLGFVFGCTRTILRVTAISGAETRGLRC